MRFNNYSFLTAVLFSFAIFFSSSLAHAVGDAGCGLGSMIFTRNSVISQLSAGTTNGSSLNQTFGMTSGTSNCKANSLVMVEKEQIYIAESNFENLKVELAQGTGENLIAFAQVLGCGHHATAQFGAFVKSKYEKFFPSKKTTPLEMLDSVKNELKVHQELSKQCVRLG